MAELYGEVMVSLLWTRVKLCGRIDGVKVIIRLWMLVRLWVKGNRLSEDLLPLAEVCVFLLATCPSPLTPEVSNRPAWMVCDLSTDPSYGRGLLVPHRGGFGEHRIWVKQKVPTMSEESSPHSTSTAQHYLWISAPYWRSTSTWEILHIHIWPQLTYLEINTQTVLPVNVTH